jgi:hypothetical protein
LSDAGLTGLCFGQISRLLQSMTKRGQRGHLKHSVTKSS